MTERMSTRANRTGERHAALVRTIAERRSDFVAFVRKRVQDAATAEDIVSETLARAVFRANDLRDENAIAAWLYRALRNAVVDHHRRRAATGRALAGWSREASLEAQRIQEGPARGRACPCVQKVAAALKPEYAEALERIEVEGTALRAFAAEVGISASNAAVRVFRARDALRRAVVATCGVCARDRCVDCTCREVEPTRAPTVTLTAPPALVVDLLSWVSTRRRAYRETLDAWRTSCPRLPVWEDAVDNGLVEIVREDGRDDLAVRVTPAGRAFLERYPRG